MMNPDSDIPRPRYNVMIATIATIATIAMVVGIVAAGATAARAQHLPSPMLNGETVKVSDHVWAIMGFPNIGIVVGTRAVLVVDTGLGPRNGATVAKVVAALAPRKKLYLTTTHFHPEHAAGEGGFPEGTTLIRDTMQQQEAEAHGQEMIDMFSGFSPENKELLAGVHLRKPDVTFDSEYDLDLGGGVKARLLWLGQAHTKGDELVFVEPDKTLISGDVVQNKTVPNIFGDGGTPASWVAVLDKVGPLGALHVLPDHSAIGDGSLVAQDRAFISDLRARALELKGRGIPVDEAGTSLTAEFKSRYPDWPITSLASFVKSVYAE
jgi:glyoxylase-like metal-dependent hydrolase (beta-lactamase superfamily II)